uniref:F-box protein GID2 n=1 Tax=Kalanchoe fedtschenkoi TaxID=63787 RepID=A0A7N0TQ23_KALFE
MKRSSPEPGGAAAGHDLKKKAKIAEDDAVGEGVDSGFHSLDENLLYEVLKHADAKTLATAACVCRGWSRTAADERLWELICTRQWNNIGCGNQQLRSVVLALGGFRRLHSLYIWPLSKPASSSSSSSSPVAASASASTSSGWRVKPRQQRWGKDEVHLSLSLLSIRYYEKMNFGMKR